MGFLQDLLGTGKPKVASTLSDSQEQINQALTQLLLGPGGTGGLLGQQVQGYPGQIVPGLDQGYSAVRQLLQGYNPMATLQQYLGPALSGKPSYDVSPGAISSYFQKGVAQPAYQSFQQDVLPRIKEGFASPGNVFSSRQGTAVSNQLGDLSRQLASQLGQYQIQGQGLAAQLAESAANRQVQAGQYLAGAPLAFGQGIEGLLQPFQQNKQAQASGKYQEFLRTSAPNPYLQLALGLLNTQQTSAYRQPGLLNTLGGAGSDILGIGTAFGGLGFLNGGLGGLFGGGGGLFGSQPYNPSGGFNVR